MNVNEIKSEILGVGSMEDIKSIRNTVNARFKELSKQRKFDFRVGDKVSFKTRKGLTITGKVTKIMQKNIKVEELPGVTWRVAPSLLEHSA